MLKHLQTTTSTNDVALQWAQEGAPHGAVVRADSQTAGRGRQGRNWESPRGCGLYLSLIWREGFSLAQVPHLTMATALAASHTLKNLAPSTRAAVKWPNDILLNEKKIGGVLCEARADFVVIGIGLNINFSRDDLPPHTKIPATSLFLETNKKFDVDEVQTILLQQMNTALADYSENGWSELRRRFLQNDFLQGRRVVVEEARETYRGVAVGLDENGHLRVSSGGQTRVVVAGDVRLDEEL